MPEAVGDRGGDEAAVASAGAEGHGLPLKHHDVESRVAVDRVPSRPEAGEPAADHHQVAGERAIDGGAEGWRIRLVGPEDGRLRAAKGFGGKSEQAGGCNGHRASPSIRSAARTMPEALRIFSLAAATRSRSSQSVNSWSIAVRSSCGANL